MKTGLCIKERIFTLGRFSHLVMVIFQILLRII